MCARVYILGYINCSGSFYVRLNVEKVSLVTISRLCAWSTYNARVSSQHSSEIAPNTFGLNGLCSDLETKCTAEAEL